MGGTPKSSILIYSHRVSRINQLFWGTPQLWQPAYTVNVYQCVVCYLHFFPWSFMKANHNISASRSPTWQRDSFVVRILGMYEWNFAKGEAPQTLWLSLVYHRCFLVFFPMFLRRNWHFGDPPQSPTLCFIGSPYLLDRRLGGWDNGGSHES